MAGKEPGREGPGWLPPIPVGDEVLVCRYCSHTTPRWYQNQTGPQAPPPGRDGNIRLKAHVEDNHREERRREMARAASRRAYEKKRALR